MPIQNLLWGGLTQTSGGASVLDSEARLSVREGYHTGSTYEYVNIGDFHLDSFSYGGPRSQNLRLDASAGVARLNNYSTAFDRNFESGLLYRQNFLYSDLFSRDFETSGDAWSVTGGYLRITNPSQMSSVLLNKRTEMRDMRLTIKTRSSAMETLPSVELGARWNDFPTRTKYALYYYPGGGDVFRFERYEDGSSKRVEDSGAVSLSNDTWYWFRMTVLGDRIVVAYSTDGQNYNTVLDIRDPVIYEGGAGFYSGAGTKTQDVDDFHVEELTRIYTGQDILEKASAMGEVDDVNVARQLSGFSTFQYTSGTSYSAGTTEGYDQLDIYTTGSGNSWHWALTSGNSYSNFVLDCQIKGGGSNWAGINTGFSNDWLGFYLFFGSTSDNDVEHWNGSRNTEDQTIPIDVRADKWYDLRMYKSGKRIAWYVNNTLAGVRYGLSSPISSLSRVGVHVYRGGDTTYPAISFRDFRISHLADVAEEVQISAGSKPASVLNRYIPDGYAYNARPGSMDVFPIGASRGDTGLTNYIHLSQQEVSNIASARTYVAHSSANRGKAENLNPRLYNQFDSAQSADIYDDNIKTNEDAIERIQSSVSYQEKDIETIPVKITPRLTLERFDKLNYIDDRLGVSMQYIVSDTRKAINFNTGSLSQDLSLQRGASFDDI